MSFLLKTLERIVDRYLRDTVLKIYPLHKNQHAYQAGKSTESALHHVVARIERAISKKQFALGIFMDIEGAFDNAPFVAIKNALQERGVKSSLIRWVSNMLRTRHASASLCGESVDVLVSRGCPQGGVLSPLLWNLVIDSLLWKLEKLMSYSQAYEMK